MKKIIRQLGAGAFITGMVIFVLSVSLGKYRLTDATVQNQGVGEKYDALQQAAKPLIGRTFDSNFSFIHALKEAIKKANKTIIDRYAIPRNLARQMAEQCERGGQYQYQISVIDQVLNGNDAINQYQNKSLKDYSGWMNEKQYASLSELETALLKVIDNINTSLAWTKAFDGYHTKNILFSMTKVSATGTLKEHHMYWFLLSFGLIIIGALIYYYGEYVGATAGIKNNHIFTDKLTGRGWLGIGLGACMITFYITLYFFPEYLTNWVTLVDPISYRLNGGPASHWFLYGFLYTLAVTVMGVRMLLKYRNNRYQMLRTCSVIFFQLAIAFILPEILASLHKPGFDFKNIWPLDYDFFYSYNLQAMMQSGALGWFMLFWGLALIIIAVPVLSYFFGKRWYCSWVCGCGGLAETLGDPFRQLSDKSLKAWKVERYLIYGVLVFAVINTAGVLYTFFTDSYSLMGISTEGIKSSYGFLISSIFAGVVGTGFYPIMGNRVWCRFGCPLAAYLGIVQRFKSRFRITTNGGQCISCGNCSTYCEMGIDVRWYAQRGQDIVRASCVGCGICSAVCPRGVLRLENGPTKNRIRVPKLTGHQSN